MNRLARAIRQVRGYRRQFGTAYAALFLLRSVVDRSLTPIDAYLLRVEGLRGVLGPAHRGYRGHTAFDNRDQWSAYDWSHGGEEWGPPESRAALIKEELLPRLPPDPVVVEIGPGAGRWSAELQPLAKHLVLLDVTDEAVEICRRRFSEVSNVEVLRTDGASLPGIAPGSVDVVWSMEAFVHMAPVDVAAYIGEIARTLKPNGFALIHHAGRYHRRGWRAPMTRELFGRLAAERGLSVERQLDRWGGGAFNVHASHDAITILRRPR
jgi:SAM-dependent methyltransferase